MLEAFEGLRPSGMIDARHKNGKPADNRWPENLEWATKSRNKQDVNHHNPPARYTTTPAVAKAIKLALAKSSHRGHITEIATKFNVSKSVVKHIKYGACHKDITP